MSGDSDDDQGFAPVDLPLELAGDRDDELQAAAAAWRRPWWQWLFGLTILVIGLWVMGWVIPTHQLEVRRLALSWCIAEEVDEQLDPETCRKGSLWLAKLSPLTSARADYVLARGDYEAVRRRLFNSLNTREGAAARNQAARELVEASARVRETSAPLRRSESSPRLRVMRPVKDLLAAGALGTAVELGVGELEQGRPVDWAVYPAALARAELSQLVVLARAVDEYEPRASRLQRGAWLCLLGERELGATWLRDVALREEKRQRPWDWTSTDARLAVAACTGEVVEVGEVAGIRRGEVEVWLAAREAARNPDTAHWGEPEQRGEELNLPTLAQAVVHARPEADALLRWVRADRAGLAPWVAPSERARAVGAGELFPPGLPIYAPEVLMAAATFVAGRADEALAAGLAFTPPTPQVEDGLELQGEAKGEVEPDALEGPGPGERLSQVAALLALEASVELIARGKFEAARAAASLALARFEPDEQWRAVWPLLSAGDLIAALAWTQERRAQLPQLEEWRELGGVELEALAQLGRYAAARACLAELEALAPGPRESAREHQQWKDEHLVAWAKALDAVGDAGVPTRSEPLRFVQGTLPNLGWAFASRESDDAGVAEQWLDAHFAEHLLASGRAALWSRVDEARRLGQEREQAHWQARVEELLALAVDEDTAMLLHLAGI